MCREGISPNAKTYGKLIEAAAKAARLKDAERWFRELELQRDEIGTVPYIMLIDAACRERDLPAAERWLKRLADSGQKLDHLAFHGIMSAAAAVGDMKSASVWLQKMLDSNLELVDMSLITVAQKFAETGDLDATEQWLNKAVNPSQRVLATSRVVLSTLRLDADRWLVAEELLAKITFDIDSSCKSSDGCPISQEAASLRCLAVKEMVRFHLDRGDQDNVKRWLRAASCVNCDRDVFRKMYLEMLKASVSDIRKAEQIFSDAQQGGFEDLHFFSMMVDAAAKSQDFVAAERWFEKTLDAGLEPDLVLFTSMVDAAARTQDMRAAEYWQSRAQTVGFEPNKVMMSTLVKGFALAGRKDKALRWAARALERFGPDLVILNCLIDLHAKGGSLSDAETVLNEILSKGLRPDERSFGPIINAYAEKGNFDGALNYFRQMVEVHHIPPSVIQYNQLLKACARCRPPLAQEAERIFTELLALDAEQRGKKYQTRDLHPTRITLKSLGRCVGARRLSEICEELAVVMINSEG
eukprot:Skav215847  [mRNA]  locus=scaffold1630:151457:153034:- [translate_table: standard]